MSDIEIFSLFGSILVDSDQADASLSRIDSRAQGTSKTFGELVTSAGQVGSKVALAMGTAAIAVGGLAVKFTDDLTKSINGVQASTGIADEQMAGMKDTMIDIYNNNFGEGFEDIGAAMAVINQQTGLTGEALQGVTENALALKDTFEMEVSDSVRGANQLMKQFGITGEESYNLIAQGAQWGLDANGDLLDTLNEYSGTFKAQGFSAEEMFNMLQNGAASGVRDVDLLADAVKEFGIRSVDGSKASAEGFKALGLDAGAMTKEFAKGGDSSKAAFEKTTTALLAMKDPVAQTAAGVALFGTQFEDLGIKGITALTNTQGEISKTVDAMGKINAVKYDSFGEAMEGIKRSLQTGILLPLGEEIMPKLNEFATWITTNMPAIKNEISYAINVVLDNAPLIVGAVASLTAAYVIHKAIVIATTVATTAMTVAQGIQGGVMAIHRGALLLATAAQWGYMVAMESGSIWLGIVAAAQWVFNAALTANPIGLTVLAIGGLIAILITVTGKWGAVTDAIKNAFNWLTNWNNKKVVNKSATITENRVTNYLSGKMLPSHAKGTDYFEGGLTHINELGGEIVDLPTGTRIIPHDVSMEMAKNGKNGGSNVLTLSIQKFVNNRAQDIEELAQELEMYRQMHNKSIGGT